MDGDGVECSFTVVGANNVNYQVSVNTTLMEDATAGLPVDAKHRPVAVRDSNGNAVVFSVGTDNHLYAVYYDPSTKQGWNQLEISKMFGENVSASAYTATQHNDGTFQIAFAVHVGGSNNATLYLSKRISNDVTKFVKDLVTLSTYFTRSDNIGGAEITQLMLGRDEASNIFIALASQSDKKVFKHYLINVDPSVTTNTWSEYPLPHNIDEMLYVAIGFHYDPGTFRLYRVGNSKVLEFVTVYPDEFGKFIHVPFNTPDNANVLAVTKGSADNDDLYVGGNGLFYFDGAANSKTATMITDNKKTPNVREVILSQDSAHLSAWVMTETEDLMYMTKQKSGGTWSNPIALFGHAAQVTPLRNQLQQANEVFLVSTDNQLYHVSQDPSTTIWRSQQVVLRNTGRTVTFKCYATCVGVTDPTGKTTDITTKENPKLKVVPSAWGYYIINNQTHLINSSNGVDVELDGTNRITILTKVSDLEAPKFTISSSLFGTSSFTVDPSTFAFAKLRSMDENGLKNATYNNGPNKGKKVLQGQYASSGNIATSHKVLQNMTNLSYITTPDGKGSTDDLKKSGVVMNQDTSKKIDTSKLKHGYSWGFVTNDKGETSFFDDKNAIAQIIKYVAPPIYFIGDLIEHFVHNLQKHPKSFWVHFTPENLLTVIFDFGDAVLQTVVDSLSGLFKALSWVLEKLFGIDLNQILEWLGSLFDWDDIKKTHNEIRTLANSFLDLAPEALETVKGKITGMAVYLEEKVNSLQTDLPPELRDYSVGKYGDPQSKKFNKDNGNTLGSHSANWSNYQVEHGMDLGKPSGNNLEDSGKQILKDIMSLFTEVGDTVTQLFSDLGQLFTNHNASVGQLFEKLGIDLLKHLIRLTTKALVLMIDLFKGAFVLLKTVINERINIPLITWLYEKYVGSDMTLLDVICLLIAVPTTVMSKIFGQKPFSHGGASLNFKDIFHGVAFPGPNAQPHAQPHMMMMAATSNKRALTADSTEDKSQSAGIDYGFNGGIIYSIAGAMYWFLNIICGVKKKAEGLAKLIPLLSLIRLAVSFPVGGHWLEYSLWASALLGVGIDFLATGIWDLPNAGGLMTKPVFGKQIGTTVEIASVIKCIQAVLNLLFIIPLCVVDSTVIRDEKDDDQKKWLYADIPLKTIQNVLGSVERFADGLIGLGGEGNVYVLVAESVGELLGDTINLVRIGISHNYSKIHKVY